MNQPNPSSEQEIQFEFKGTATQYFGIWIVNLLLTIITLGIYTPWAKVRTKRYFYGNTLLDGSPFDYLASPITILKGWALAVVVVIAYNILKNIFPISSLLLLPLLLLALPWVIVRAMRFRARNSAWRNIRFGFRKAYAESFKVFVGVQLLMLLTLGLLLPYYYYAINRFMVNNSGYGTASFRFHAKANDFYRIFLKPTLAMLAVLAVLITLSYSTMKEYYDHFKAAVEASQTLQKENAETEYSGDEIPLDAYDETVVADTDMSAEEIAAATQDESVSDALSNIAADASYEQQHAAMMEQAMQDLAAAQADLANAEMGTSQSAEMMSDGQPEMLAEGDVEVGILDPVGSGDEEYAGIELPPPGEELASENADVSTGAAAMLAAFMGMLILLLVVLFYLVFIAYIQSRTWNLVYNSTELAGHRFRSTVRARDIIWLYASNLLLISLSFGLMIPWAKIRMARYRAAKLVFLPAGNLDNFIQAQQEKINALGEEIGDVFDLDIGI